MAEGSNLVRDLRQQFQNFFSSLSIAKRITMVSVLAVIVLGMGLLIVISNREVWSPLYSGLEPGDASMIVQKLQDNQIPFSLAPGGRTVMVPAKMVDQARLTLAQEKVLPGSGVGFLDLFSTSSLGETEFQQQVKFRVAQEGELARLVTRIHAIKSAKISLAIPKKSLFSEADEKPTASISLEVTESLSKSQVDTVLHLVAAAVEGLTPGRIRITDQSGKLLNKGMEDGSVSGELDETYSYKRRFEVELEEKIMAQLEPIVGEGRVRVKVFAKIGFDQETIKEHLVDPEQSSLLSEQIVNENSSGSRSIPVGAAGVSVSLPETSGREAATVSEFGKQHTTRNFETSRKEVTKEPSSGQIQGISVSVLLDNKRPVILDKSQNIVGRDNVPWTTAEKEDIDHLVRAAIGFTDSIQRKDQVFVTNMPFGKPVEEDVQNQVDTENRRHTFVLDTVRYVSLGMAILALIFLVIRPMVQRLSTKPGDLDLLMGLPATIGELEGEELEIPTDREAGVPPRDKIIDMARQDPLKTASLIRNWLREKK